MITLLWVIIIGGLVGWAASLVTKSEQRYGILANIVIGIVGSFFAGVITSLVAGRDLAELGTFTWESVFWSFLGAVALILIINSLRDKRTPRSRL